jgi:hypothetical protein
MRALKVRRAVVVLAGAFFLGLLTFGAFSLWRGGREWLWWGSGCAAGALALSCLLAAAGIPGRLGAELDERRARLVLEAMGDSYRMLTGLMAIAAAGAIFADLAEIHPASGGDWKVLLLAIVMLVSFFPTALIAWRDVEGSSAGEQE